MVSHKEVYSICSSILEQCLDTDEYDTAMQIHMPYAALAAYGSFDLVNKRLMDSLNRTNRSEMYQYWYTHKYIEEASIKLFEATMRAPEAVLASTKDRKIIDYCTKKIVAAASAIRLLDQTHLMLLGENAADYDSSAKTIRFFSVNDGEYPRSISMADGAFTANEMKEEQDWVLAEMESWTDFKHYNFVSRHGHLHLMSYKAIGKICNMDQLKKPFPTDALLFDNSIEIDGVSLEKFELFMAVLRRWSRISLDLFSKYTTRGIPFENIGAIHIPTKKLFYRTVQKHVGLEISEIDTIVQWLEWDRDGGHSDLFLSPLITTKSTVGWSARSILSTQHRRNLFKKLSRDPSYQNQIANLIGMRSSHMLQEMDSVFLNQNYVSYHESNYNYNGLIGDIDYLCWSSSSPEEILVIECKANIQPDSPYEVGNLTRDRKKFDKQITKSIEYLKQCPHHILKDRFPDIPWDSVSQYYGLLVTLQGMPFLSPNQCIHPTVSFVAIKQYLANDWMSSPSVMIDAIEKWVWIPEVKWCRGEDEELSIGGYKFYIPTWQSN